VLSNVHSPRAQCTIFTPSLAIFPLATTPRPDHVCGVQSRFLELSIGGRRPSAQAQRAATSRRLVVSRLLPRHRTTVGQHGQGQSSTSARRASWHADIISCPGRSYCSDVPRSTLHHRCRSSVVKSAPKTKIRARDDILTNLSTFIPPSLAYQKHNSAPLVLYHQRLL